IVQAERTGQAHAIGYTTRFDRHSGRGRSPARPRNQTADRCPTASATIIRMFNPMRMQLLPRLTIATLLSAVMIQAGAATQSAAATARPSGPPNDGASGSTPNSRPLIPSIDINYTKYVLDNGLTLIVHEDHSTPIV